MKRLQKNKNILICVIAVLLLFLDLIAYHIIIYVTCNMGRFFIYAILIISLMLLIKLNYKEILESKKIMYNILKKIFLPFISILLGGLLIISLFNIIFKVDIIRAMYAINPGGQAFALDSDNKYLVETPMKTISYASDGGSHINDYYEIDLDSRTITELEDEYKGTKGYLYIGKVQEKKTIEESKIEEYKRIFDLIGSNVDTGLLDEVKEAETEEGLKKIPERSYYYIYTISSNDYSEVKVRNPEIINELEKLIEEK